MLQIWENYVEGEEVSTNGKAVETKQKEVLKVCRTMYFVVVLVNVL